MSNSKHDEKRITALDADPDGIDWKAQQPDDEQPKGPLTWSDAMLSLLMRLGGFHELFTRRMRAHLEQDRRPDGNVDAHAATTKALLEVLVELERERKRLVNQGLDHLELAGVDRAKLHPHFVGQDWSESTLTEAGRLVMRVKLWMRRTPELEVKLERPLQIMLPRDAHSVRVKTS